MKANNMNNKRDAKMYYVQSIPTQLISNYEFENKLRKFCLDNPSRKKDGSHGYHRNQNIAHKEKDHPRYYKEGGRVKQIERMFAQMFC